MRTSNCTSVMGAFLATLLGGACGGGDGAGAGSGGNGITIADQNLSGTIGGQPWSLATAQSDSFLSTADRLFVTMYPSAFVACEAFASPTGMNEVIVELPTKVGAYDLSLAMNATLYDAATSYNLVAIRGRIQIDSVTATTITGGAHIISNTANTVDGRFQASICP